jgi:MFS family permease
LILGAGKGFGEPTTVVYVTDVSPSKRYGTSFGLFLTLRDLGLLVGPVVLGKLADLVNLRFPLYANALSMLVLTLVFGFLAAETLKKPARRTLDSEKAAC